jgi:transketolase
VKARLTVEAASTLGWSRYAGAEGQCLGMETFGASAPLPALLEKFGFTADRIVAAALELLKPGR